MCLWGLNCETGISWILEFLCLILSDWIILKFYVSNTNQKCNSWVFLSVLRSSRSQRCCISLDVIFILPKKETFFMVQLCDLPAFLYLNFCWLRKGVEQQLSKVNDLSFEPYSHTQCISELISPKISRQRGM